MKLFKKHKPPLPRSIYILLVAVMLANFAVTFVMVEYFK